VDGSFFVVGLKLMDGSEKKFQMWHIKIKPCQTSMEDFLGKIPCFSSNTISAFDPPD